MVPDLPGCFSAGDTMDEAVVNASEAIAGRVEAVLDDGGDLPMLGAIDVHRAKREFKGWVWALSEVDNLR